MGTTVLLLHAFPVGPEMWDPQLKALAGYQLRAPSLIGRGESIDDWALQLLTETDDELVLIGASMGGYCALAMAKRAPERLRGLVLVGSHAAADTPEGKVWRDQSIVRVRANGPLAQWQTMRDFALGADSDLPAAWRLESAISGYDPEGVIQELIAMIGREDTTDVVRTLPCPFLAIAGELDQGTAAAAKKLVELAPEGELVIVPGANHLVSFQRPDLVNPVLLGFLERCIP
ncbi:MAG: alpha/beta fold hydrolase [Gaiellaceae bacterium]